jgi:predicted nucleotidyltransferase
MIDILPFGDIEKDEEVFVGNPPHTLSVYGTKEILSHSEVVEGNFRTVSLPGLCLMKLISHYERPERIKDIEDFYFILLNYEALAGDTVLENEEYEDLITNDFDLGIASARMLGRQMAGIMTLRPDILRKVEKNLKKQMQSFTTDDIDGMYRKAPHDKILKKFRYVVEVLKGIKDAEILL